MAINQFGYAGGITSLFIVALAYLCASVFLTRYITSRRIEPLLQGIVFFAVGSSWLGVLFGFLYALRGETLGKVAVIRIWGWAPAVIATVWVYLVLSTIKPRFKLIGVLICGVLNIIYLYLVYANTDQYSTYQIVGGVPDSSLTGLASLFLFIHILIIILVVAITYLWIGFKSETPSVRLQGKVVGIAVLIFASFAILDSAVLLQSVLFIIVVRAMLIISIFFVYLGFTLPEWLRERFIK